MFGMSNYTSLDLGLSAFDLGVSETQTYSLDFVENKTSSSANPVWNEEQRMQMDKKITLSSLIKSDDLSSCMYSTDEAQMFEDHSNLQQFLEMSDLEEVKEEVPDTIESHQSLIDEIEDLLSSMETPVQNDQSDLENCPLESSAIDDSDKAMAERLIDDLFMSTIEVERENLSVFESQDEFIMADGPRLADSGFEESLADARECQIGDVIIIVAPDSSFGEVESQIADPPSVDEDSDTAWSPASSATTSKKRPYSKRSPERKRLSGVDKKERKKKQNVEAARRYRDKKKNEQQLLDEELEVLHNRNDQLRGQVSEKENELKTLKKLMIELGLVKVGAKF